eukprot:Gb_20960 [translate_table: standard]
MKLYRECWVSARADVGFMYVLVMAVIVIGKLAIADPTISVQEYVTCNSDLHPNSATFERNYVVAMKSISAQNDLHRFGVQKEGNDSNSIYALFQCREDLSHTDCSLCFSEARTQVSAKCTLYSGGRIYMDGCFLRYHTRSFFNQTMDAADTKICGSQKSIQPQSFLRSTQKLLNIITTQTLEKGDFSVGSTDGPSTKIYALAECWKTLSKPLCRDCILNASAKILSCSPSFQGQALNAGCYMRYDTSPFFNLTSQSAASTSGDYVRQLGKLIAWVADSPCLGLLIWRKKRNSHRLQQRLLQRNEAQNESGGQSFAILHSQLNFKYETLEIATNNFDPANKLGEGGFGSVYKGTLPEGREIAVKRLFYNTGQDVREFLNEVNLISGVQHKNLVKLLGCSVKGPERLLVYEYLANKSLDRFLFDATKNRLLDWGSRFDIILGIAMGLAYLHEGSEIRIIHRDIKPSNVLLDENLKPKIADFGLARYFAADQSHLSTGVAGTLGYMAPEYVVRGQLTEKADIFSFGVLVLEILSGKRNSSFIPAEATQSLLAVIWNHYQAEKVADIIDPNCNMEEALRVVQVALLCTQASATLRPSMSKVVQMLTNKEQKLPVPRQPPFVELQAASDQTFHLPYKFGASISEASINDVTLSVPQPRLLQHSKPRWDIPNP